MNPRYDAVSERANHRCEYCHAPELVFNFPFEVEHVVPLSRQGTNDLENLALACRSCNLRKGTRIRASENGSSAMSYRSIITIETDERGGKPCTCSLSAQFFCFRS